MLLFDKDGTVPARSFNLLFIIRNTFTHAIANSNRIFYLQLLFNPVAKMRSMEGPAYQRIPPWVKAKLSPQAIETIQKVHDWVENECIPAEQIMEAQLKEHRWVTPPIMKELRKKAKARGLFNLFLPNHLKESPGLTNLEYSCCAAIMGRCYWAAQVCSLTEISRRLS
jgi:hypothetical protein